MPFLGEVSPEREPIAEVNKDGIHDDFHKLVQELSDVLGPTSGIDSEDVDPQDIMDLMRHYTSEDDHWLPYAFGDPSRNYTRNLVDEGNGKSNLLILVWNPGKGSAIHDHANAHCVMKILKGTLQETVYTAPEIPTTDKVKLATSGSTGADEVTSTPEPMRTTNYHRDEVTYIADDIGLHKITNPSPTEVAVSLHLYTPPHAANFGFNMFCEQTGKITHCKQAGCFSNRGRKVRVGLNGAM